MSYAPESIPEIMRRTMENLRMVDDLREERRRRGIDIDRHGPYEVTQLVNSFLGALAHPWEALFKGRDISRFSAVRQVSERLALAQTEPETPINLTLQLDYLRNGFAHGNIEFLPTPEESGRSTDIRGVRIWNCEGGPGNQVKNWEIQLDVGELRLLLDAFGRAATALYDAALVRRRGDCSVEKAEVTRKQLKAAP